MNQMSLVLHFNIQAAVSVSGSYSQLLTQVSLDLAASEVMGTIYSWPIMGVHARWWQQLATVSVMVNKLLHDDREFGAAAAQLVNYSYTRELFSPYNCALDRVVYSCYLRSIASWSKHSTERARSVALYRNTSNKHSYIWREILPAWRIVDSLQVNIQNFT